MEENERKIISRAEAKALGLNRYFTAVPCKHGHVAERLVNLGRCTECSRDRNLEWASNNRDKKKKMRKKRYEKHREEEKAKALAYIRNNPEKTKESVAIAKRDIKPWYVANQIGIPVRNLTEEIYALKRQQIEIRRLTKQLTQSIKEIQNDK